MTSFWVVRIVLHTDVAVAAIGFDILGLEVGIGAQFLCTTEALFATSERYSVFQTKAKPADLAGFSVKSLVALPGIEPGF